jgi:hypothetical protein
MPIITATSITISTASLVFVTDEMPVFGTNPSNLGEFDLVICYRRVPSEQSECLSLLDGPFLHLVNLTVPDSPLNSSTLCVRRGSFQRCFDGKHGLIRSVIARSACEGNYSFPGWFDGIPYLLTTLDNQTSFVVDLNDSFIDYASFKRLLAPDQLSGGSETLMCRLFSESFGDTEVTGSSASVSFSQAFEDTGIQSSGAFSVALLTIHDPFPSAAFSSINSLKESQHLAQRSTAVWIGVGGSMAGLVLITGVVMLVLTCRYRPSVSGSDTTESELGVPVDVGGPASAAAVGFVSEENALSQDASKAGRIELGHEGRSEHLLAHTLHE